MLTACEELEPVMRSSQGRHDAHDFSQQNIAETDQAETWQDGKVQTGNSGAYQGRETQTGNSEMYQEREAETGNTMIHQQREVQTGNTDPAKMLQFAEKGKPLKCVCSALQCMCKHLMYMVCFSCVHA